MVNDEMLCYQIEWEDAQKLAKRHYEREQGQKAASTELSELSDSEKSDQLVGPNSKKVLSRNFSDFEMFIKQPQSKKSLYIVLIRYHLAYNIILGIVEIYVLLLLTYYESIFDVLLYG